MSRHITAVPGKRDDSVAMCVGDVISAALEQLASMGAADPAVALAVGDHCTVELDEFIRRCRQHQTRLRISDSLRIEPSRLLEDAADDRPAGLNARVIASAGDAAWLQACGLVLAALDAGEASGAIACAVCGNVVCAFAIVDDVHAPGSPVRADVSADADGQALAVPAAVNGTVSRLGHVLDCALATSKAGVPADARRGEAHIRVANLQEERPRLRRPR